MQRCPDNVFFCCSPGTDIICECGSYDNFDWVPEFNNATTNYNKGKMSQGDLVSTWKGLVTKHRAMPAPAPQGSGMDFPPQLPKRPLTT